MNKVCVLASRKLANCPKLKGFITEGAFNKCNNNLLTRLQHFFGTSESLMMALMALYEPVMLKVSGFPRQRYCVRQKIQVHAGKLNMDNQQRQYCEVKTLNGSCCNVSKMLFGKLIRARSHDTHILRFMFSG